MSEDARLDDFLSSEDVEDAASSAESDTDEASGSTESVASSDESATATDGASTGSASTDDAEPVGDAGATSADVASSSNGTATAAAEDGAAPVQRTSYCRPDGGRCEHCGSSADRLWNDEGAHVCADCATWGR